MRDKYKQRLYESNYRKTEKGRTQRKYTEAKSRAKRRGLSFSLSKEEYYRILANFICYYCNNSFKNEYAGINLDRIDNNKGYEKENVLPCCGHCNILRHTHLTIKETKIIIKLLKRLRKKEDLWK